MQRTLLNTFTKYKRKRSFASCHVKVVRDYQPWLHNKYMPFHSQRLWSFQRHFSTRPKPKKGHYFS